MDRVFRGKYKDVAFIAQYVEGAEPYVFVGPASGLDLEEIEEQRKPIDVDFAWDERLFESTGLPWRHNVAEWICYQMDAVLA